MSAYGQAVATIVSDEKFMLCPQFALGMMEYSFGLRFNADLTKQPVAYEAGRQYAAATGRGALRFAVRGRISQADLAEFARLRAERVIRCGAMPRPKPKPRGAEEMGL